MWKACFAVCALLFVATLNAMPVSAAASTLSVDPEDKQVAQDETFTLSIKLNSDVIVSGVQTDIEFDQTLLQIVDTVLAGPFDGATALVGVAPQTKAQAIAEANTTTGKLENVAAFFLPGAGGAPPGDSEVIVVTFKAGASGGVSTITLSDTETTDDQSNDVPTTGEEGQVTVAGPTASPTPVGQTPTPSPSPSPEPSVTPSPSPTLVPVASIAITPATFAVRPGAEYILTLTQNTNQTTTGSQASIKFDPAMIQIVTVTKGTAFAKASLVMGVAPVTGTAAIAAANTTGLLQAVSAFVIPPNTIASGQQEFVTIKIQAKAGVSGTTKIELTNLEMLDTAGNLIGVTAAGAQGEVSVNAPLSLTGLPRGGGTVASDSTPVLWLLAGAFAAMTGAFVLARVTRRR